MKSHFLIKQNKKELIVFFGGFASLPSHFKHLKSLNFDVLMIYDYTDFTLELKFSKYEKIHLIAFSMGVCVASKHFKQKATSKIAINGTNYGCDKHFGINPSAFKLTIKHFNTEIFKKNLLSYDETNFILDDENLLKEELASLYELCTKDVNLNFIWDKAYISKKDLIFPSKACEAFFKDKSKIEFLDEPHFVFFAFKFWDELCKI